VQSQIGVIQVNLQDRDTKTSGLTVSHPCISPGITVTEHLTSWAGNISFINMQSNLLGDCKNIRLSRGLHWSIRLA
jgi:hypothetical protein